MTPEQLAAEARDEAHFVDIGSTHIDGDCPVPGCENTSGRGLLIEGFIRTAWRPTQNDAEIELGLRVFEAMGAGVFDEWAGLPENSDQPVIYRKRVDGLWQGERRFVRHYRLDENDNLLPLLP